MDMEACFPPHSPFFGKWPKFGEVPKLAPVCALSSPLTMQEEGSILRGSILGKRKWKLLAGGRLFPLKEAQQMARDSRPEAQPQHPPVDTNQWGRESYAASSEQDDHWKHPGQVYLHCCSRKASPRAPQKRFQSHKLQPTSRAASLLAGDRNITCL